MFSASDQTPTCRADQKTRSKVVSNKTLVGGLEAGKFNFVGVVRYCKTNSNPGRHTCPIHSNCLKTVSHTFSLNYALYVIRVGLYQDDVLVRDDPLAFRALPNDVLGLRTGCSYSYPLLNIYFPS